MIERKLLLSKCGEIKLDLLDEEISFEFFFHPPKEMEMEDEYLQLDLTREDVEDLITVLQESLKELKDF